MEELKERVRGANYYNKIDLKTGYHLIRIKEIDKWKTAFRCRYKLFQYTDMRFGLTNTPATFLDKMDHIFRDTRDQGMLTFTDNIIT